MRIDRTKLFTVLVLVAMLVLATVFAGVVSASSSPWMEVRFLRVLVSEIIDGDLTVGDDITVTDGATVGGTLDVTGNTTLGGTLGVTGTTAVSGSITQSDGNLTVADLAIVSAQTAITVTNGAAFTPTGTYQPLDAASEVTPTITVGSAGQLLVLINTSTNVINIADTGTTKLTAAAALGQYDSLTLWCDGTNWIEVSRSNN